MDFSKLENNLKITFSNKDLLREALTHRSYLNEHPEKKFASNERLEFLGDAILEFLITKGLFESFPEAPEGELTALRSQIVKTKTLAKIAQKLNIGEFLLLSRGEEEGGGKENETLLANTLEALLGAVFLDRGIQGASKFVKTYFDAEVLSSAAQNLKDFKSLIQEIIQEKEKVTPVYKIIKQTGPDHAKIFTAGVFLKKRVLGKGTGYSKQEAEQKAAKAALEKYSLKKV